MRLFNMQTKYYKVIENMFFRIKENDIFIFWIILQVDDDFAALVAFDAFPTILHIC